MDNHPIPQDVTGFQFKLIGNMTIKQFAYLATGIVLAWILFQLPIGFLIKIPLCGSLAILGIGLAFFPVSGRPMDLMIGHFIKALFRPTQFVYEKSGNSLFPKQAFVTKMNESNFNLLPKDQLKAYIQTKVTPPSSVPTPAKPFTEPPPPPKPQQKPVPKTINPMPYIKGRVTGVPSVPDFPNLITGVIKDPRGNPLSNILVEVKDKDGNPVRAFKTNEVGRFASATPLLNGTYTVEFEDPKEQNKFEGEAINVAGQIIMPIEKISIDTREELRKSLFNNSQNG